MSNSYVFTEYELKRFIVGSVAFVARLLSLLSAISSTVSPEIGVTLVFGVGCKYLYCMRSRSLQNSRLL